MPFSQVRSEKAGLCGHLPTPPKGMLARVMCMKPSFPQKPPLLVRVSTCLTTWEKVATRLRGCRQVPGALPSPQRSWKWLS